MKKKTCTVGYALLPPHPISLPSNPFTRPSYNSHLSLISPNLFPSLPKILSSAIFQTSFQISHYDVYIPPIFR